MNKIFLPDLAVGFKKFKFKNLLIIFRPKRRKLLEKGNSKAFREGENVLFKHYSYDEKDSTNIANHDNLDAFYDCYDIGLPRACNDRRSNMNDQNKKATDKYQDKKTTDKYQDKKATDKYPGMNGQNKK